MTAQPPRAPRPRVMLWQGTMLLGEKLSKGPPQTLWQAKAYINTSSDKLPAAFGRNWPSELV